MNKCTLLIDGNWLLISRFSVMKSLFESDRSEAELDQAVVDLKDMMAKSINIMLNRMPFIDNMIFISDGGSWRKQLPIPEQLEVTYKGNREEEKKSDISWNHVFKALNEISKSIKQSGINTSSYINIEGDDWMWYWSRRLNSNGTNCIIWSSDNDLKQLVQYKQGAFTAWYNDQKGGKIFFPSDMKLDNPDPNDIDFFMQPMRFKPVIQEQIEHKVVSTNYIDPNSIINSKVICGDAGDNIKSVARVSRNGRTYGIGPKDWEKMSEKYNISTIYDLMSHKEDIISYILGIKRYRDLDPADVEEMIEYNIKLVWLNESVIPEPIVTAMNKQEYKDVDLSYFRNSYTALLGNDDRDVIDIFDSINNINN